MKSNHNLFEFDKQQPCKMLIGTDEAGRGSAAGGVFASAVYINNKEIEQDLGKLNDSKKLSQKVREELYDIIINNTINSTICIEVEEIEKTNILACSLKAMKLACENVIAKLNIQDSLLTIVDGNQLIRNYDYPQKIVKKGDATSASIAAASILAKVSRDNYMQKLDAEFPQYNWKKNAGYLTKEHSEAILKYGITKYHRKSFLKNLLAETKQLSFL